ncbi:hypothetical protein [Campylobacter fetus]|uniref:hypothetical protein n=1 Tax=Campylobacter fetus TaxID=196 RepID=UPI0003C28E86|nr:hypothetical protein [Campylobacter fetus]AGZ81244.1 hypothetical protein CFT03427_0357 [Campylobacter fetus subsp. testudinum 03-427]EAI4321643.1 hypothetical protein [Campylobacter fetus]EAI4391497.1 hypothetical protein [Campylobacter fetus]OCS10662.1 hypothetical protein CFTD6783_01890 [Campylobacter fetus subsp. testudinum]OCS12338.1 hypothetical protein CFTD6690_02170 [Campylobacter fetus subsp. testudinum]
MDKITSFPLSGFFGSGLLDELANVSTKDRGVMPYIVNSDDEKITANLSNLGSKFTQDEIMNAFGYKKNEDGTYSLKNSQDIIRGDLSLLSPQERVKLTHQNEFIPLTGFTRYDANKISIWGKLMGYDPDFSDEQIRDLKNFIDESGGIAVEQIEALQYNPNPKSRILRTTPYTADELASQNANTFGFVWRFYELEGELPHTISLLDSDLSVEKFKSQWAKHVIKIRFGLDISDEDAKNAVDIFKELNAGQFQNKDNKTNLNEAQKDKDDDKKFTPIQGFSVDNTTYKDDAISRLKKLYEIIKKEFEDGKTELEILKLIAKTNVNLKV